MATLTTTPIKTFVSGETVTPTKLNELSQSAVALTAGTIVDADVAADAAIAASKLALAGAITNAELAASAITAQTVIADPLADTDEFLVHDAGAAALRRVAWSALQPAGSVLQVVASSQNLSGTKQSATIVDSGLTAVSITRKQSTSKLLLHMSGGRWQCNGNIANTYFFVSQNGGGYANIVTLGNNTVENVESYAGTTIGTHVASYMFIPGSNITTVALKVYYLTSGAAQWHLTNSTPFFISITEISA